MPAHREPLGCRHGSVEGEPQDAREHDRRPRRVEVEEERRAPDPDPELLLRAAEKYGVLLDRAYFIGDSDSDVLAGQRAGCRTILIRARPADGREAQADFVVNSLSAAVDVVLKDAV